MAKFKKGDRVRVIKIDVVDVREQPFIRVGVLGTILENDTIPFVNLDGIGKVLLNEKQLELVQDNTITIILGNTAYEITGENITIKTKEL